MKKNAVYYGIILFTVIGFTRNFVFSQRGKGARPVSAVSPRSVVPSKRTGAKASVPKMGAPKKMPNVSQRKRVGVSSSRAKTAAPSSPLIKVQQTPKIQSGSIPPATQLPVVTHTAPANITHSPVTASRPVLSNSKLKKENQTRYDRNKNAAKRFATGNNRRGRRNYRYTRATPFAYFQPVLLTSPYFDDPGRSGYYPTDENFPYPADATISQPEILGINPQADYLTPPVPPAQPTQVLTPESQTDTQIPQDSVEYQNEEGPQEEADITTLSIRPSAAESKDIQLLMDNLIIESLMSSNQDFYLK